MKFKALSNGTLSNPYRFVEKDQVIDIPDDQVEFFAKSKWLRPLEEVNRTPTPPIMPFMKVSGMNGIQAIEASRNPPPSPTLHNYDSNMAAILRKEAVQDKVAAENKAAADATIGEVGTGNLDPIG